MPLAVPGTCLCSAASARPVATCEQLVPTDTQERLVFARRLVAGRCLYGVDANPLAAEMAKLSLWLLTLAKDKPFEFLDHAVRCGDSLVGLHDLDQLRYFSLKADASDAVLFKGPLENAVDEAIALRLKLEGASSNTVEDVEVQEKLLHDADEKMARLRCAADLLVASELWGENSKDEKERAYQTAAIAERHVEHGLPRSSSYSRPTSDVARTRSIGRWSFQKYLTEVASMRFSAIRRFYEGT